MADTNNNSNTFRFYAVWDKTTRFFHWINFICVLLLIILGTLILNSGLFSIASEGKIFLKELHTYVGYVFAVNLFWRLLWAFIGTRYARWRAILPGGKGYLTELLVYLKSMFKPQAPTYLGHNPLGRLMVASLLVLLLAQALTGLILAGTDLYKPPFGSLIAEWVTQGDPQKLAALKPGSKEHVDAAAYADMRQYRKPVITTHVYAFYILCVMILLHIAAVVIAEIKEGNGLVSAMFSGRKVATKEPVDKIDSN